MANEPIVLGLAAGGKVPGARLAVNVGVGRVDPSTQPRFLLLIGNKTSEGSLTVNTQIQEIFPNTDVADLVGARSELFWQIAVARLYAGVRIKVIAVPEAPGGTAAVGTITVTGTASTNGNLRFYMVGRTINVAIASGMNPTAIASAIADAFNADPNVPVTADDDTGVATLTAANVGIRGNDLSFYWDPDGKPGTTTLALAGGASVNPGPGGIVGVKLGSGAGSDNVTTALAALAGAEYFTIAPAQNDVGTNVPLLRAYNDAKAALGTQIYEHMVFGHTGSLSGAQTLAKTTLNRHRSQVAWQRGAEATAAMLGASMAGLRTQKEQLHPNQSFNSEVLLGIPPQRAIVDRPSDGETGEQQTALDNGVTPITSDDQQSTCIRSITTLCLKRGVAFYGCIDSGQARTPDACAQLLQFAWVTEYGKNNPYVNDDPANGEKDRPEGVATPRLWAAYAQGLLAGKIPDNWLASCNVTAVYDKNNKMILTNINVEPTPLNHRLGGNVNQVF